MSHRACLLSHRGAAPRLGARVYLAPTCAVIGDVELGDDASVWFQTVVRGDVHRIRVGARTNLQDQCVVHVTTDRWATTLEDDVTVGHRAVLHGCHVGRGALIGIGAIVLDGAVVGEDAQVGAGALVAPGAHVPPRTLVLGVPAKVRRELSDEEVADHRELAQRYVELARHYREEGG